MSIFSNDRWMTEVQQVNELQQEDLQEREVNVLCYSMPHNAQ